MKAHRWAGVRVPSTDINAAWRGVRARGWTGTFVVGLLALAIAGNVVMFAFADSLVFARDPFPDAKRIVRLSGSTTSPEVIDMKSAVALLEAWQRPPDLFTAVAAFARKTLFIVGDGAAEEARTADVTLRFFDVLGVAPRWGRGFKSGDDLDASVFTVVITEDLARRRFGHPNRAIGQTLDATAGKLFIVGVMDGSFSFPNAAYKVWRAFDPLGPLARDFFSLGDFLARVAPGVPVDLLPERMATRASLVGRAAGLTTYQANARPEFGAAAGERRTMVLVLAGAALCLLLAACANVASLELAGAIRRARTYAVQLSLGAPRWHLARVAALEGFLLVGAAVLGAAGLTWLATGVLQPNLPDSLRMASNNPIDLDGRAIGFMTVVASIVWIVAAAPAVMAASRSRLIGLLKSDDRSAAASRGASRLRRALTVSEVALAVALVTCGLLYSRTYQNLLAVDKGFDSRSLFLIDWTMPRDHFASAAESWDFGQRAMEQFGKAPGIEAVTRSSPPPGTGDSPSRVTLEIDGRLVAGPSVMGRRGVDPEYFSVIRLPLKLGRLTVSGEDPTNVVVPELFARQFFPDGQAVGHTFRRSPTEPWLTIVGVVGDFRTQKTRMPQAGDRELFYYVVAAPAPPVPNAKPAAKRLDTGGVTMYRALTVRTNGRVSEAALLAIAKRVDSRAPVVISSVDDEYAKQSQDTQLASQIVGGFSILAFVIAMAGVYGVMAFLVAGRTREIGIRMALGADGRAVQRLVLGSSARMVVAGAVLGLLLAFAASRWIESQLFGVSSTAPWTYLLAAGTAVGVALLATWHPARQAARVDPAITLRSE